MFALKVFHFCKTRYKIKLLSKDFETPCFHLLGGAKGAPALEKWNCSHGVSLPDWFFSWMVYLVGLFGVLGLISFFESG